MERHRPERGAAEPLRPTKPVRVRHWFVAFSRALAKPFIGFGRGAKWTPELREAIDFLRWEISAEEFRACSVALMLLGVFLAMVVIIVAFFIVEGDVSNVVFLLPTAGGLFLPIAFFRLYTSYPLSVAAGEKMLALAHVPEIVNYLVMSMRLVPILERACEFAATHGRGKIADDLRRVVWEVQVGRWRSIEEALDDLAYRWAPYSEEFKHALMLIRNSVLEPSAEKREELLSKAVEDVLTGAREKMDVYARSLHQPTVYLYYFGILLPLMMAIVLPIGGAMTGVNIAKGEYIFAIYNVALPIGVFVFGKRILGGRPPTYVPPDIPATFPGLPPPGQFALGGLRLPILPTAIAAAILVAIAFWAADVYIVQAGFPAHRATELLEKYPHLLAFCDPKAQAKCSPYIGQLTIYGFIVAASVGASIYLLARFGARKRIQDEVRTLEGEFRDAVYVLASRLGEGRPIEEALRHSRDFLPKSLIAKRVFGRIVDNISTLGMTIDEAIFHKTFGAVKDVPSAIIRSGMRILCDSVGLGVSVAARSLMSLAMQIRDAQKIDEALRRLLEDVTIMLKTMSIFVAPIVLAVVAAMQQLITSSIMGVGAAPGPSEPVGTIGFASIAKMLRPEALAGAADPAMFSLIMGIYVIQVTAILTYFNSQVEDAQNRLHTFVSVALALPIAAALFVITAFLSSQFLAAIAG